MGLFTTAFPPGLKAVTIGFAQGGQGIIVDKAVSLTSAVTSGIGIGGALGSAVPLVGNAVGTAVGSVVGLGYALFTKDKKEPAVTVLRKIFFAAFDSALPGKVTSTVAGNIGTLQVSVSSADVAAIIAEIESKVLANFNPRTDDYGDMVAAFSSMQIEEASSAKGNAIFYFNEPIHADNRKPAVAGATGSDHTAGASPNVPMLGIVAAAFIALIGR